MIGQAGDGDIEFASMFEETAWEQRHSVALDDVKDDPDAVSMVIFTSGTTGEPKAALHTHNTVYTSFAGRCEALGFEQSDVVFCPHALMHLAGHLLAHTALTTGASIVLLDSWSGARGLQVMVESRTSRMMAAPVFIYDLLTAIRERTGPNDLPPLRTMLTGATTVPAPLVADVQKVFGTPLQTLWAMTESALGRRSVPTIRRTGPLTATAAPCGQWNWICDRTTRSTAKIRANSSYEAVASVSRRWDATPVKWW
ncbi:hypothetical protein A5787_21660 [Mycobacterium sp. 852002-50816_SCH5313054-b]|nr:hypothetical protein A5787_21660 [Mycobacterium sp. 852002-50816_SCH5313054-b]